MTIETIETGDVTYADRFKRWEYIMARRGETPRPTLQKIADELHISRQNVHRIIKKGKVKPSGRPRSNEGRRKRVAARLEKWYARRLAKAVKALPVDVEDGWITKLEAELRALV